MEPHTAVSHDPIKEDHSHRPHPHKIKNRHCRTFKTHTNSMSSSRARPNCHLRRFQNKNEIIQLIQRGNPDYRVNGNNFCRRSLARSLEPIKAATNLQQHQHRQPQTNPVVGAPIHHRLLKIPDGPNLYVANRQSAQLVSERHKSETRATFPLDSLKRVFRFDVSSYCTDSHQMSFHEFKQVMTSMTNQLHEQRQQNPDCVIVLYCDSGVNRSMALAMMFMMKHHWQQIPPSFVHWLQTIDNAKASIDSTWNNLTNRCFRIHLRRIFDNFKTQQSSPHWTMEMDSNTVSP